MTALNLVRKLVRYKRQENKNKKTKKNKVVNFVKLDYTKKVFDFHNIEYHITFLITKIAGQQCQTGESSKYSSLRNSSTI